VIRVAHHDRASQVAETLEALGRLRAALRVIAEADDVVDGLAAEIGEERVEGDRVAVDVREQRDADDRLLAAGLCER
jgi:hypothetical protein